MDASWLWRPVMALGFVLALTAVPISRVAACSCGMGETADVIRAAQLAFVGTVADQRDSGVRSEFGGELREYAFVVARSNVPTDAVTLIVAGTAGPSCGIVFGDDEEWLIIASRTPAGLETNLCSGDVRMADLGAAERAAILELLPAEPSVEPGASEPAAEQPAEPSDPSTAEEEPSLDPGGIAVLLVVVALVSLLLAGVGLLAFARRGASARP